MGKKQKRTKLKQTPTKGQLSKWQRQARMRRIIIGVAAVFLAGIIGYAGYGYYESKVKPLHEVVIRVNDTSFNMDYYVKIFDAYTGEAQPSQLYYMPDIIANQIVQDELIRQGANSLGIEIRDEEIDKEIEENNLPDDKIYYDIVTASLLGEKLQEYFASQLPHTMEQAHIQVMLVETQEVADDATGRMETSGNFTALVDEFSCNPQIEGDLGWLPQELMPNPLIGDAVVDLKLGEVQSIYDESTIKSVGYWLIEVSDKDEEKGIKARAILLGSRKEAEEVKAQLTDENFAELADEYSQYEGEEDGGELGWLKQGDMNSDAFDEVAFNLTLAAISEPVKDGSVQTKGGYWIVKVLEKGDHELSEDVREKLKMKSFNAWFKEQEENSVIGNYLDEEKKSWAVDRVLKGR